MSGMSYGPDGSVLPAMMRLQRRDKLCWAVIKFVPSPAQLSPDGVLWNSPGKCFSVESFGEKKDGSIADWSRFIESLPGEECRLGLFRFDFRAVRKFVLLSWSPPSTKSSKWDDTKIWDIRKQVQPSPNMCGPVLSANAYRIFAGTERRHRSSSGGGGGERPEPAISPDRAASRADSGGEGSRHLCSRVPDSGRISSQATKGHSRRNLHRAVA